MSQVDMDSVSTTGTCDLRHQQTSKNWEPEVSAVYAHELHDTLPQFSAARSSLPRLAEANEQLDFICDDLQCLADRSRALALIHPLPTRKLQRLASQYNDLFDEACRLMTEITRRVRSPRCSATPTSTKSHQSQSSISSITSTDWLKDEASFDSGCYSMQSSSIGKPQVISHQSTTSVSSAYSDSSHSDRPITPAQRILHEHYALLNSTYPVYSTAEN